MVNYLATVAEVKKTAKLTNEYTGTEMGDYLTDVEYEIFADYPNFKKYSEITINTDYDAIYYIHNKDSIYTPYKLTNVREEDDNVDAGWTSVSYSSWNVGSYAPTIVVPTVVQTGSDDVKYRIDWIPKIFNRLAILLTYKRMLDNGIIFTNSSPDNPTSFLVQQDIDNIKKILKPRTKILRSSVYEEYDPMEYIEYEQYDTD